MIYSQMRDTIKNGDLLVWDSMPIVNFFTQSSYSHVGIALWIGKRLFVLEADIPEVRLYPLSQKASFYIITGVAPDWNEEVTDFALEFIGNKYSIWDAIRSLFVPLKVNGSWQCVEYAKFIYRKMGIELNDNYLPKEIVREFLTKGYNISYVINDLYKGRMPTNTDVFADFKSKVETITPTTTQAPIVGIIEEVAKHDEKVVDGVFKESEAKVESDVKSVEPTITNPSSTDPVDSKPPVETATTSVEPVLNVSGNTNTITK